jgi:glycosyltransferase involved in cell wall biosynthesis
MKNYSIGITTFSKRFDHLSKLVDQIRQLDDCDILLTINGNYNCEFDEDYRKKVLSLCCQYTKIYPIFFPEQRGLAKLWNTITIHSKTDWILMVNDDIELTENEIFTILNNLSKNEPDIKRINGSFSHFILHKDCIDDLGYFDERLLGFGEEDGDIFYRYIKKYNKWLQNISVHGFKNLCVSTRDENIKAGTGKYSAFNRNFCFHNNNCKYKPDDNGISGMFGLKMIKNLVDEPQYCYEKFFKEHKNKL